MDTTTAKRTAACAATSLFLVNPILYFTGFTTGGIAAGSLASAWQASMGNVAAGSVFSSLQSAAALGVGWTAAAAGGGIAGATAVVNWMPSGAGEAVTSLASTVVAVLPSASAVAESVVGVASTATGFIWTALRVLKPPGDAYTITHNDVIDDVAGRKLLLDHILLSPSVAPNAISGGIFHELFSFF
ncbi:uncharacterized protein AMSG_10080, partial [Thecamonas trahens ATCC 50062]